MNEFYKFNTNDLTNFINVDKLRVGGLETEYCLYVIRSIAQQSKYQQWDESILDILETIANIDFEKLDQANKKMANFAIIVDIIYEILDVVSTKRPYLIHRCQNIDNELSLANKWVETQAINAKLGGSNLLQYFLKFRARIDMVNAADRLSNSFDR